MKTQQARVAPALLRDLQAARSAEGRHGNGDRHLQRRGRHGSVAGAADFAGVDQSDPLGTAAGGGVESGSAPTVTLTGLNGDELVFDNVFRAPPAPRRR